MNSYEQQAIDGARIIERAVGLSIRCATGNADTESALSEDELGVVRHLLSHFAGTVEAVAFEDAATLVDQYLMAAFDENPLDRPEDSELSEEAWQYLAAVCRQQRIQDLEGVASGLRGAAKVLLEGQK